MRFLFLSLFIFIGVNSHAQKKTNKEYKVKISTDLGDMIVKLYNETPGHRDNFIQNIKDGVYDGSLFHRVIPAFMAQGGDPASIGADATKRIGADKCGTIPAEINRSFFHKKGALAAARIADQNNPERKSSACQFYIVDGYKFNDERLDNLENANYKFPEKNRAFYKAMGGYPALDMQYTIFGEVIEGLEVIDIITAMRTGKHVKDRPNADIRMHISIVED